MKQRTLFKGIGYIGVFLLLIGSFPSLSAQKSYKELKFPKLKELKIPEPSRFVLENGMVVYLLEDHELPLVNVMTYIRTGSRWEPPDKVGLAGITGTVMRTGGTNSKTGDQLDEELETIGGSVETSIGLTSGSARMSVLKEDTDKGLAILADVLMNPVFREDKIELAKIRARDTISRRNDNVNEIARREFSKLIYGASSPYARHSEYKTIDNIARADLVAFYKRFFVPKNVILGAWGDFNTADMKAKIEKAFKDWKASETGPPPVPEVGASFRKAVYFIKKEDVNQTNIRIGHIGGKMNDPDYYALTVLGEVLGGGFASRLFKNVRSIQGLAYSAYGTWRANYDFPGLFIMDGETKSGTTVQAIKAFIEQAEQMTKKEVTDQELQIAKDSILNSFVFNFDTKAEIVNRILAYDYYGYPKDFLMRYKDNVEKVTKADILRVANKYLHPDRMVILAVGREKDFDQPLSVLGDVKTIDITIPKETPQIPAASAENVQKGKQLLSSALKAMGGDKLKALKDITRVNQASIASPQGEVTANIETAILYPDKFKQTLRLPGGEVIYVMNGQTGWAKTPQGMQELSESQKNDLAESVFRDTINLFKNLDGDRITPQFVERADVDGKKADVVLVSNKEGKTVKLYLDATDHLLLKKAYRSTMGAPAEVEEMFSDYRDTSGVRIPFKTITKRNGQKFIDASLTDVKINSGLDEKIFRKE